MRLVFLSQWRFVQRAPWSALGAVAGVALGVASVVAVHLIGIRVERSLDAATPPQLRGLTHVADRTGLDARNYFALRRAWRRADDGRVGDLVPLLQGYAEVGGRGVTLVGADWLLAPRGSAASAIAAPGLDGALLVGEALLADRQLGVSAGQSVTLGGRRYRIDGVVDSGLGPALFGDIAAVQDALGTGPDALTMVGLVVADPWRRWRHALDGVMPGLSAGLPVPGDQPLTAVFPATVAAALPHAGSWRVRSIDALRPDATFARSVLFNLGALGTLALLVAWFLVHQVAVIWLRRQHLLLSRLHVVGVDAVTLRRAFLGLFLLFGVVATFVGTALGGWLAAALLRFSTQGAGLGADLPAALDGWVAVKALVSGVGVCLFGGFGAFQREWAPSGPRAVTGRVRALLASGLGAVVMVGIGWSASGVLGAFAAVLAACLLLVMAVRPVLRLIGGLADRLRLGWTERLAVRDIVRFPQLLSAALAALALAVATGIAVATMVASFRADFERMLGVRLAGDLYVYPVGAGAGAVRRWLHEQPQVVRVVAYGQQRISVAGRPAELGYTAFDARQSARYGHPGALRTGDALVSERLARDLGLRVGGRLAIAATELTVVGVFPGYGDSVGRILVDRSSLESLGEPARFDRLSVDSAAAEDLAQRLTERFPGLHVELRSALRHAALATFDRTFAITRALTALALLVAAVGTYNALTALRLQQAGTERLLVTQGAGVASLRRIVRLRALIAGAVAAILALPLGLAMAWALCAVINPRSFGWTVPVQLPAAGWLPPLLLGLAAAWLAGTLPAPREQGALHDAD